MSCPAAEMVDGSQVLYLEQVSSFSFFFILCITKVYV